MSTARLSAPAAALLLTLFLGLAAGAAAGTGLPMLRLNTGPRGAAMGDAMSAVRDVDAASANPAALIARQRQSLALGHTSWIQDMQYNHAALSRTWGRLVLGGAVQLSQADELERRTGPSATALGTFGVYTGAITLTAARTWGTRWRAGASVRAIRQSVSTESAAGAGVDLGVLCDLGNDLVLGAALRNLGSMGKLDRESTELPTAVRAGVSYGGLPGLLVSLEAQRARGGSITRHAGVEYALEHGLCLRLGYQTADSRGLSGGLGLALGSWSVDYAYVPFAYGLGEAHRLSIQLHQQSHK
jgi:hypothetical protein